MDFLTMTNSAVTAELGQRIQLLRLRKNISQQQLADSTALSLKTIRSIETGRGKLSTFIAVLRALGALQAMDGFLPEVSISPIQMAKLQGRQRKRASSPRGVRVNKVDE